MGEAKPPSVIPFDRAEFAASFEVAFEADRSGREMGAVSAVMREAGAALRVDAMAHSNRGDKIAGRLSRTTDQLIRTLYQYAPSSDLDFAICAVGGYGRRELSIHSDIDLLFLHEPGDDADVKRILDFYLYPLWDSGAIIGHGVQTPKSAIAFAKQDLVGRTSYLDARYLVGSRSLYDKFLAGFDRLRQSTGAQFVAAKLKEQDERHAALGETRYLVEPNIKEGKGGLRDLQTIRWIYRYVFDGRIGHHEKIDTILGEKAVHDLIRAERFLWSVRAHLHAFRGRADEVLAFDAQPVVAERLGYADRRDMTAAERLMRHYFVTTVNVGRLTRILCARLEEEQAKRTPRLPKLTPRDLVKDELAGRANLRLKNGRLDFADHQLASESPIDFFRLFRAYSKFPKLDFHPDALETVSNNVAMVTSAVRKDPDAIMLFRAMLESSRSPVRVLRVMAETGLLGKFVIAFGEIIGRIQYGLYRRYTLDEHVLRTIDVYRLLEGGKLIDDHPIATRIVRAKKKRYFFTLVLLFHETIWAVKGRSKSECERRVRLKLRWLGLSAEQAALGAWGSVYFTHFIRTAERRDITEAATIALFARHVGTQEKLDLMIVLAACHLPIIGYHNWDDVSRRQLTKLYEGASAWLSGGDDALNRHLDERADFARADAARRLGHWSEPARDAFLARLGSSLLHSVDSDILVRFAELAWAADKDKSAAGVTVTPRDGDLECLVYADDRPGLLADLAGAVASVGLSVRVFQAFTLQDGRAFDVITVHDEEGGLADDKERAKRLHQALLCAAKEELAKPLKFSKKIGDRRSLFSVDPSVRLDEHGSEAALVAEAEGLDRPGLLYDIASAFVDLQVVVVSAHIATYGERAVDAFYLTDINGAKIDDPALMSSIAGRLMAVLSAGSAA